jgi:outer membrane protein assembly factor BamB
MNAAKGSLTTAMKTAGARIAFRGRSALGVFVFIFVAGGPGLAMAAAVSLGSEKFVPTPEHPVGWRGDGSGRYPGATPPMSWERRTNGNGYTTKGIAWMTPLPNSGVATPIVVGEKIFLTAEVSDLICLDKRTGKILWIRSNPEFESLSAEDRKTNSAYAEKLAPLAVELAKANTEAVAMLNARLATAPTNASRTLDPVLKRKRDLEKQINDAQLAIDKKGFARYWGQAVFGFAGQTPASDGKHVCVFFTTGVSACYDLEGNRQWIAGGRGGGSEHGNFASPLLCANRLVVWANEMRAYDVDSGKLIWTNAAKAFNTYGSLFHVESGGEPVACFQWGFFARVRDGQPAWNQGAFGDSVTTPIVEGDMIFARAGYPKFNEKIAGLKAFKIPVSTESGKLTPAYDFKEQWADDEMVVDKQKNPFDRGFVASPLFVDGLIYQVTQGGGLLVNDAATGELVYRKVLPLKARTHYWDWAGCSASPTLAGKFIYFMDNQGTTLVLQPGREYQVVTENFLAESKDGKEQAQFNSTPIFEGTRMYYRSPGHLYCVGSK